MDSAAIQQYLTDQGCAINGVLGRVVKAHGCPCHWPQFEYWVSKSQGPGWQDGFQNDLISAALKLPSFQKRPPEEPLYELEAVVSCSVCARDWQYFSEEWRMLAFRYRLIPVSPFPAAQFGGELVAANVFATAGLEPDEIRKLSLAEWVEFMQDGLPDEPATSRPLLSRVLSWLRLRD